MSTNVNKVRKRGNVTETKDFGPSAANVIFEDEDNLVNKYQDLADIIPAKTKMELKAETWNIPNMTGKAVWHSLDNNHIYYSEGTRQYELNKDTNTWVEKSWSGLTDFDGWNVWHDKDNEGNAITYYSDGIEKQYYLDENGVWQTKTWDNNVPVVNALKGERAWQSQNNEDFTEWSTYFSTNDKIYNLYKDENTWKELEDAPYSFEGEDVTDLFIPMEGSIFRMRIASNPNIIIYLSYNDWSPIPTNYFGIEGFYGRNVWSAPTLGTFLSEGNGQYKITFSQTSSRPFFVPIEWVNNIAPTSGEYIWLDYDNNPHYSNEDDSNIKNGLIKEKEAVYIGTAAGRDIPESGNAESDQLVTIDDSRLWRTKILYNTVPDEDDLDSGGHGSILCFVMEEFI
jgi:hypothetical protein